MASKAAARHHMIRHLPMTRRTVTVAVSAVVAVAVMAGYFVANIYDVAPGILTLRGVDSVAIPDPQDALTGGTVAAGVDASMPVDAQAAKTILDEFSASEGVGKSFSLAIADGKGNIVADHDSPPARIDPEDTDRVRGGDHAGHGLHARHQDLSHPGRRQPQDRGAAG